MLTSDMELTLDTYIVMPTSTGLPEYMQTQRQCVIYQLSYSLFFHETNVLQWSMFFRN